MNEGRADRLRKFINLCYNGKVAEFSRTVEKKHQQIHSYLNGTNFGYNVAQDFQDKAGLDANWLLTGTGDMLSDNELGLKLKSSMTGLKTASNGITENDVIKSGDTVVFSFNGQKLEGIIEKK